MTNTQSIRERKHVKASQRKQLQELRRSLAGDRFWERHLQRGLSASRSNRPSVHLAVFVEPYLQLVLDGRKTVESRFSVVRCAPYGRVQEDDIVVLKRSGGPVVGICQIGQTWHYRLDPSSWQTIKREFTEAICVQDPEFWRSRERASYATLMRIHRVRSVEPLAWPKRDRRGWVVVRSGPDRTLFEVL